MSITPGAKTFFNILFYLNFMCNFYYKQNNLGSGGVGPHGKKGEGESAFKNTCEKGAFVLLG